MPGKSVMRFDSPSQTVNQTSHASSATHTPAIPAAGHRFITSSTSPSSPPNPIAPSEVDNNVAHDAELVSIDDYIPIAENGYIPWTDSTLNTLVFVMTEDVDRVRDSTRFEPKKNSSLQSI